MTTARRLVLRPAARRACGEHTRVARAREVQRGRRCVCRACEVMGVHATTSRRVLQLAIIDHPNGPSARPQPEVPAPEEGGPVESECDGHARPQVCVYGQSMPFPCTNATAHLDSCSEHMRGDVDSTRGLLQLHWYIHHDHARNGFLNYTARRTRASSIQT